MSKSSNGVTGAELLLVVFIVLKLTKVINWSWWWVLSPLWIIPALILTGWGIYVLYNIAKDAIKTMGK